MSATLGQHDPHYKIKNSSGSYNTENPANHLTASFADEGISLQQRDTRWGMNLTDWGYDQKIQMSANVSPHAIANRIEYDRENLTESYVNGPLGLEQSFLVAKAPWNENTTQHLLTLEFALKGNWKNLEGSHSHALTLLDDSGRPALRYAGLTVHDASGRELNSWIEAPDQTMRVRVDAEGAKFPVTIDPTYSEVAQLSGAPANSFLGTATAVSDDGTVVVASACGSDPSTGSCSVTTNGAAYVFSTPTPGSWAGVTAPIVTLTAPDAAQGTIGDQFGTAVAISGDGKTIVVSAPQHSCQTESTGFVECFGEAYVFTATAESAWATANQSLTAVAVLTPSGASEGGYFATSLAIDYHGSTIVAREFPTGTPYAYVNMYLKPAGGWAGAGTLTENVELQPLQPGSFDNFGVGLAISENSANKSNQVVAVGAFGANGGSGEAYVFQEDSKGWSSLNPGYPATPPPTLTETVDLLNSDVNGSSGFGLAAAVDDAGDTVVIGAPYQNDEEEYGEAYVFVIPTDGWAAGVNPLNETTRLEPAAVLLQDALFGEQLSISDAGNVILVGSVSNAVYQFGVAAGTPPPWPSGPIYTATTNTFTQSGASEATALSGLLSGNANTVFISYLQSNSNAGAVFVYEAQAPTCPAITVTPSGALTPNATAGVLYSEQFSANNGTGPYTWTVSSAPTWLSMNSTGLLSGTPPLDAGGTTVTLTVAATDANNCMGSAPASLTVNSAPPVGTTTTFTTSSSFHGQTLPSSVALVGNPVTVNFTVKPVSGNAIPTGSVVVTDGGLGDACAPSPTPLTVGTDTGSCSVTIATFPQGGETSLTAAYTSNANAFLSSTSSALAEQVVEGVVPCGGAIAPVTVQQKASVTATFTVCLAGNLNLANVPLAVHVLECLPFAVCNVTITPVANEPGIYTVSVKMITSDAGNGTASSPILPPRRGPGAWPPVFLVLATLLAILTAFLLARHTSGRRSLVYSAALILAFLLASIAGCNSGGSSSAGLTPLGPAVVNLNVVAGAFNANVAVNVIVAK